MKWPLAAPAFGIDLLIDNSPLVLHESKTFNYDVLGVDRQSHKIVWRYENTQASFPFRSSAAVTPSAVIVGSRDRLLHALDPKTGKSELVELPEGVHGPSGIATDGSRLWISNADSPSITVFGTEIFLLLFIYD